MPGRYFSFTAEQFSTPPADWCLPGIVALIDQWEQLFGRFRRGGPIIVPSGGCGFSQECPYPPETLATRADAWMRDQGITPRDAPELPLDVYTMARNLRSEFGDGTAMEKLCIAWAGLNRVRWESAASVTAQMLGTKGTYGRQVGRTRPVATTQDPSVTDILIAHYVYADWQHNGFAHDISQGGVAYFDKVSQDAQHARKPETNPDWKTVFESWSSGGDWLTWTGHIPDVRVYRLCLLGPRPDLKTNPSERSKITALGVQALLGQNRAPKATWCAR